MSLDWMLVVEWDRKLGGVELRQDFECGESCPELWGCGEYFGVV
jgi:hypothetical protein